MPSQYLTVQELRTLPLGLDVKNIPVPNAAPAENYAALLQVIQNASAMMDDYCRQSLQAATVTRTISGGRLAGVNRDGDLWVEMGYHPLLVVSAFAFGYPSTGTCYMDSVDVSKVMIRGARQSRLYYPAGGLVRFGWPTLEVRATVAYGYANTFLASAVAADDLGLPVRDASGVLPGSELTVYDGLRTEGVTVASTYTPASGPRTLPLIGKLLYDHTPVAQPNAAPVQVAVSALPASIRQVCGQYCKFLIEQRGTTALVMTAAGKVQPQASSRARIPDEVLASLEPYRRVL